MENSSKVLLIVAAVLIVIILIVLGIKILNSTGSVNSKAEDVGTGITNASIVTTWDLSSSFETTREFSNQSSTAYLPVDSVERNNADNWYVDTNGYIKKNDGSTEELNLKVGDIVNYNEENKEYTPTETKFHKNAKFKTENLTWKILGVNSNGNIELISTNPTNHDFYTGGLNDYQILDTVLNNICNNLYGQNELVESARNLNINDVTKYFGTSTFNANYKYYFKYNVENLCIDYSADGQNYYEFTKAVPFYLPDGNVINAENQGPVEVKIYNQIVRGENGELTTSNRGNGFLELSEKIKAIKENGTEEEKNKYNFMFKGELSENEIYQWISSKYLEVINNTVDSNLYIRYSILEFSATHKNISNCGLYYSYNNMIQNTESSGNMKLRPVITLKKGVQFNVESYNSGNDTFVIN